MLELLALIAADVRAQSWAPAGVSFAESVDVARAHARRQNRPEIVHAHGRDAVCALSCVVVGG